MRTVESRRLRGLAFCGVTGAGKSTVTDAVTRRLSDQSVALLRNELIQNPGLATYRESGVDGVRWFLKNQAERCAQVIELLGERGHLVCESFGVNLLAECGTADHSAYADADQLRAELGIVLVRLDIGADEVLERSVLSTRRHRGPRWSRYLDALAADLHGQAEVLEQRRRLINQHFAHSAEPKISISTSRMNWDEIADQLIELLKGRDS